MEKISDAEFMKRSSELRIEDFITNVQNPNVTNETIEDMFWDIFRQGNEEKIEQALEVLRYETPRKEVALEVAEAIKNDQPNQEVPA